MGAGGEIVNSPAPNGHAGWPGMGGLGYFFTVRVTLEGQIDPVSNYLLNIKQVDQLVRERGVPTVAAHVRDGTFGGGGRVARDLFGALANAWPGTRMVSVGLSLSPYLVLSVHAREPQMVHLSEKFEFSASHRLFNPALADEENRRLFGKCSNPHGHGHNYELQVTVAGEPDAHGVVLPVPELEQVVGRAVIERFDHKNLNVEVAEFKEMIPSVENIAAVIYRLLKGKFARAELKSVTVWETPKTWCEYSE
jgi:6-pyruvoyltetrahydropterin/6-carboxytetrahydropterin synthase